MTDPRPRARPGSVSGLVRLSRLVALVLRHRPDEVGIRLDSGGFVDVEELARALAGQAGWASIGPSDLLAVAAADPRRYEVRDGRIRARYGHTVAVESPGEAAWPPQWLYLGMARAELARARERGLEPTSRQLLHLSATPQAALDVGRRHAGDPAVVVIFARAAAAAGVEFRRAGTALYLTGHVPPAFLQIPDDALDRV